ncbi:helix-turn-helix domain-containing protein [Streptomyces sp. NPDC051662]|uniref:nSTAND1 domain-containing NTPase n=1 Tax=Streptomyces sp. NPDC051662 TaxID=3154750 RepID=UPI00341366EB
MGRQESPLDPAQGTVQRFAFELRKVRQQVDGMTYRAMARRTGLSAVTLSQAAAGRKLPTLEVLLAYVSACGGDGEEWERRWHEAVGEEAAQEPPPENAGDSPYRGLARFEVADSLLFFGRDRLVEDLRDIVRRRRFTALIGPSGSGKSSLLRAGLIGRLREETDPALRPAAIRVLTPGPRPGLDRAHLLTPKDADGDTVVVIDQLEEVFTLCSDPAERACFINALLAAGAPNSRLRVVIAVRADYFGRCTEFRDLADNLNDGTLVVGPMTPAELRDAVIKPAQAAGLTVERTLTARILGEIADEPGGLPLMSHALLETWRRRKGGMLTEAAYEAIGGVHGAVANTAEHFYTGLPPAQASLSRRILLRLVTPGEGDQDTCRPTNRAELDTGRLHDTAVVLERLTRARLITLDEGTVNLAHEALIRAWPRLRAWIDAERDRLRAHRRLTEAARTWYELGHDPGALYRGTRLAMNQELFASSEQHAALTSVERSFLTASIRRHHRATRLRRAVTVGLVVLALLASAAAITAYRQSTTARAERNTAIFHQVRAQADSLRGSQSSLAAQLDLTAYRMRPTPELYTRLVTGANGPLSAALPGHTGMIASVRFGPNGRDLVTVDSDGVVARWDLTHSSHPVSVGKPLAGRSEAVTAVAVSPNGNLLAIADGKGTVRLWNITDPRRPKGLGEPLTGHSDLLWGMAFSPDGRTLATAEFDGAVRLFSLVNPGHPKALGEMRTERDDVIHSLAFSPDSRTLATAAGDGTVQLWNLADRARPEVWGGPLNGHTKLVRSISFSPDGGTLASASHDGTVRLWNTANLATPTPLGQPLTDHTNIVSSVVFRPNGRTLATAGDDGRVRLWELPSGVVTGHSQAVVSTAFSPDGHTMATAAYDETVRLWDARRLSHPEPLGTLSLPSTAISSVVFSPDGHTMATSSIRLPQGGMVRLWNIDKPTDPEPLGAPLTGRSGGIESVAFSPDGQILATAGNDSTVRLWNITNPAHPTPLGKPLTAHNEAVYSVTFSPDGQTLATAGNDSTVRLWDITDPANAAPLGKPLTGHTAAVRSAVFTPDGITLATASHDNTVRLWNVTDPAHATPLGSPLTGHTAAVRSAAFTPDGTTLATASEDFSVRLWQLKVDRASEQICAITKDALTRQQWEKRIPQLSFDPPCT